MPEMREIGTAGLRVIQYPSGAIELQRSPLGDVVVTGIERGEFLAAIREFDQSHRDTDRYREDEGPGTIPPRRFLRKLDARIARLREIEPSLLDQWRERRGGPNLAFVEAYDKLLTEDLPGLLDSLLEREDGADDR